MHKDGFKVITEGRGLLIWSRLYATLAVKVRDEEVLAFGLFQAVPEGTLIVPHV